MALIRRLGALLVGFSTVAALAGCGEPSSGDQHALVTVTGAPVDSSAPAVEPTTPVTYEQMCRHYCETLESTVIYRCLGGGEDEATCRERFAGHADQCESLRCAPRLVQPSLCLLQCDSLARVYAPVCGALDAPLGGSICPVTPAASDEACRAGCALPSS
jgi:hypothetical protein